MSLHLREPGNALTHLAGVVLSLLGLVVLVWRAALFAGARHIVAFAVFGASLLLLYTVSTLYHALRVSDRVIGVLRKLDHMMIYVLIAGTYTPICLIALEGGWRWALLGTVWGLAALGMVFKGVSGFRLPRWLSTGLYLGMGWMAVVAIVPLARRLPTGGLVWLLAGGLLYSAGAVFYAMKWPTLTKSFGFHELFHLFVLAGSAAHYLLVARFLLRI
jgi:hemolysin III